MATPLNSPSFVVSVANPAVALERRPVRALVVAAFALVAGVLLAVFASASPALAHDELIGSSPEPGQVFETAPSEVSLSFSGDLMPIGTAIEVVDHHGEPIDSGEAVVAGPEVTATLPADLSGEYQVRWRVVSSDGHPITGTIDFGVGADATGVWTEAAPHESAGDGHAAGDDGAEASGGPDGWAIAGIVIGAIGVVALAATAVLVKVSRSRTAPGAPEEKPGAPDEKKQ